MNVPKRNIKRDDSGAAGILMCSRCRCSLEDIEIHVTYLERHFTHKVPRCPQCGQVYISEDLAEGRMAQLEKSLEEK
ncbi:MAG: DNA-binding protein [Bacillota bacterium]|nr:DNA-binding protein [Bacillota bacterium]